MNQKHDAARRSFALILLQCRPATATRIGEEFTEDPEIGQAWFDATLKILERRKAESPSYQFPDEWRIAG